MTGFACQRCGSCCRQAGYVYLQPEDIDAIAAAEGLDVMTFTERFTRLTEDRRGLSLTERPDGRCVYYDRLEGCRIQHVKPRQCREFPLLWRYAETAVICPAYRQMQV